jgi:hypothetical protein
MFIGLVPTYGRTLRDATPYAIVPPNGFEDEYHVCPSTEYARVTPGLLEFWPAAIQFDPFHVIDLTMVKGLETPTLLHV